MPFFVLPDGRGMPRAFWFLWVGTLVNTLGSFVQPFLAIYLTDVRKLPLVETGFIMSLLGVGAAFAGPVGGILCDRKGRRFTLGVSTLFGAAALLALGFFPARIGLPVAALFLGFFSNMYRAAVRAIVADIVPSNHRARAYGLLYWAVNLGFSVAPVAAGFLAQASFTMLFVVDAATTLAFGLLVILNVPETRPAPKLDDRPAAPQASLSRPYRDGVFAAFCALSLISAIVFFQANVTMPIDLRANGVSRRTFGLLFALNSLLVVTLQPAVTSVVSRLSRGPVLATAAILNGLGFGMLAIGHGSVELYALSVAIWTLGEIMDAPLIPAIVADLSPTELRGSYQGAFQITTGAASFIAPAAGSWLLDRAGSRGLWGTCVALGLLVASGQLALAPAIERRKTRTAHD